MPPGEVGTQESPAYLATLQVMPGILSHLNDCGAFVCVHRLWWWGGGLAAGSSPYVREKVIMLTTWTQPRLHGGKSQEDGEEDSSGGSPPRLRGKAFLTRCSTCKMLETHSLSPHSGASRRCPPTVTFAPCSGCSGLGNPPEGFKPVYEALPLPEASAPPVVVGSP